MDNESVTLRESYACFQITVENRDYHYLSRFEIASDKRISQHLSGLDGHSSPGFHDTHHVCAIAGLFHEVDATQQILESSV
jgi:hypothetical protein